MDKCVIESFFGICLGLKFDFDFFINFLLLFETDLHNYLLKFEVINLFEKNWIIFRINSKYDRWEVSLGCKVASLCGRETENRIQWMDGWMIHCIIRNRSNLCSKLLFVFKHASTLQLCKIKLEETVLLIVKNFSFWNII